MKSILAPFVQWNTSINTFTKVMTLQMVWSGNNIRMMKLHITPTVTYPEACWLFFKFPMHGTSLKVFSLSLTEPSWQNVFLWDWNNIQQAVDWAANQHNHLTVFFAFNHEHSDARCFRYIWLCSRVHLGLCRQMLEEQRTLPSTGNWLFTYFFSSADRTFPSLLAYSSCS